MREKKNHHDEKEKRTQKQLRQDDDEQQQQNKKKQRLCIRYWRWLKQMTTTITMTGDDINNTNNPNISSQFKIWKKKIIIYSKKLFNSNNNGTHFYSHISSLSPCPIYRFFPFFFVGMLCRTLIWVAQWNFYVFIWIFFCCFVFGLIEVRKEDRHNE